MNTTGEVVATQTAEYGHFVEIPLPPGSYTITDTFVAATICSGGPTNCWHPSETETVVIPAGDTVRKDFVLQIA
jgi:hypothetical protein